MAFTETNVGHGKNQVLKVDNAGGSLTDLSDYLASVDFKYDAEEAEAAGTGASKHYKAGQLSGDLTAEFTLSLNSAEPYRTCAAIVGSEDLDFEYGPMGSTATYPKISGKCICLGCSPKSDVKGVPGFALHLRPTGTITIGAWT